jgi:hypothetical protein
VGTPADHLAAFVQAPLEPSQSVSAASAGAASSVGMIRAACFMERLPVVVCFMVVLTAG